MTAPMAYSVADAAKAAGMSATTIRRAIRSTDPRAFPPPLKAKRAGEGIGSKHLILATDLAAWLASFPDA